MASGSFVDRLRYGLAARSWAIFSTTANEKGCGGTRGAAGLAAAPVCCDAAAAAAFCPPGGAASPPAGRARRFCAPPWPVSDWADRDSPLVSALGSPFESPLELSPLAVLSFLAVS